MKQNESPEWYPEQLEQFDPVPDLELNFKHLFIFLGTVAFAFIVGYVAGRVEISSWLHHLGR